MTKKCRIAIVGGGLAGAATAMALRTAGITAELFEAAPALREIGAAVNCSPQAVKALWGIGARERVDAVGHRSPGDHTRDMLSGEIIEVVDRHKVAEKWGAPYYSFHRADLLDALTADLDTAHVRLAHRLVRANASDEGVMLEFDNGEHVQAEYVIAADGVRSVLRKTLYGDDNPSYTGQMVWRALLKASDVTAGVLDYALEPVGHSQWVGPHRHVRAYYIRDKQLVNIVTQQDTEMWVEESWSAPGNPEDMRADFADAEPHLRTLLDQVTECQKWGLFTRPINDNWGRGRIQLIGDAAHAMVPNAGQGACQAFEDAYVLGRWMAVCTDPVEAFANFRRVRIPRVHGVQRLSLSNMKTKHMKDTQALKGMIAERKVSVRGKTDWLWGFDPAQEWDKLPVVPPEYADPA
jgi:salicylate hydroxylase